MVAVEIARASLCIEIEIQRQRSIKREYLICAVFASDHEQKVAVSIFTQT